MNKSIAFGITIALILALAGIVSADPCSIKDLCYNQDGKPYCSPADESCTYETYTTQGSACTSQAETADNDDDGWTATCDANDEDADIQVPFGNDEEEENETEEQGSSSSGGHYDGLDNVGLVSIVIKNDTPSDEEEEQNSTLIVTSGEQETKDEETPTQPQTAPQGEPDETPPTGMVASDLGGRTSWSLGFYILIALIAVALLLFFLFGKKKK